MSNITRRNLLAASALTAGLFGITGCDTSTSGDDAAVDLATPDAGSYPIDPDGDGVEAKWTSEETRDGWTRVTNPDGGTTLGVKDTAKIIQVGGLAFRDMNGNGKLDLWEDWRQSNAERAAAFSDSLSDDDCIKLMFHGGAADTSDGAEDPEFGLLRQGSRAGVSRLSSDEESYPTDIRWINEVQGICEEAELGIPYLNSTDPYSSLNIPTGLGLAPVMDKDLWRKAGMWTSRAWRATGVTVELGPQIDLYTQPTTVRLNGAESEDPALTRDFVQAFCAGMQSTWGDDDATDDRGWGDESVAVMLKHYVGAGAIETGGNDHTLGAKYDVFPGDNYNAHLIPFLDGGMHLDSQTEQMASVMPNYGIAYSDDEEYGPLVGGGFNGKQLSILRNAGWDGMICSDWNILEPMQRGLDDLTPAERCKVLFEAGVDQYGGKFYYENCGKPAYDAIAEEQGQGAASTLVHEAARRVAKVMLDVQLFDEPYCDRSVAKEVFESEEAKAFAQEINDKRIVMLKNAGGIISDGGMGDKPKVYIPQKFIPTFTNHMGTKPSSVEPAVDLDLAAQYFEVVTDTVGDPTGEPDEDGNPTYQESDITRLSPDELADVAYVLVKVKNPQDHYDGFSGGTDAPQFLTEPGGPMVYRPISLQYRPYTADGPNVKQVSIAGDLQEDGTRVNCAHYGQSSYADNEYDLDFVIDTKERLPKNAKLILLVQADHPMVFSEIEPYADAILLAWENTPDESYLRVVSGAAEPYGLLQYQMPANMDTVEAQLEDVPRDMEPYVDSEGNAYDFCFGLNWSGVIDDDRTKTYKAAPLTEPETTVEATA